MILLPLILHAAAVAAAGAALHQQRQRVRLSIITHNYEVTELLEEIQGCAQHTNDDAASDEPRGSATATATGAGQA